MRCIKLQEKKEVADVTKLHQAEKKCTEGESEILKKD